MEVEGIVRIFQKDLLNIHKDNKQTQKSALNDYLGGKKKKHKITQDSLALDWTYLDFSILIKILIANNPYAMFNPMQFLSWKSS